MIKPPKISIIIPIYNVEEYITECLQSVMRQTYKGHIECILVDDCGKDNSISVAEHLIADYKGQIEFRILHHERNRGLLQLAIPEPMLQRVIISIILTAMIISLKIV